MPEHTRILPEANCDSSEALFLSPVGQIAVSRLWDEAIFFTITKPQDAIQKMHSQGKFYEQEELEIIRAHMDPDSVFCDIGANVGNHSLFALKFLRARQAILFEPNTDVIPTLISNLVLNGIFRKCDITALGVGLSDEAASGMSMFVKRERNLGGARMVSGQAGGKLEVLRGDDALNGRLVDFLKIDVEGMELKVLKGLSQTISRCRPKIFLEVENANASRFMDWVGCFGYCVSASFRRYKSCENFMLLPT